MENFPKIGFPEGLLIKESIRLDIPLYKEGEFLVLDKPAGIYLEADGIAENPKTIVGGIKAQEGKPELARFGMQTPFAVFVTDPEISGLCLLAMNKNSATELRNAFGSGNFEFKFTILSEAPHRHVPSKVSLPILRHEEKPRAIVSHRFGKKATTAFTLLEDMGEYQLWSAKTNFLRWHQIRAHAAEAGLRPVGEDIYVRVRKLMFSRINRNGFTKKTEDERPIYEHLPYHLSSMRFMFGGESFEVSSPLPKKFELMLKRIRASQKI